MFVDFGNDSSNLLSDYSRPDLKSIIYDPYERPSKNSNNVNKNNKAPFFLF